MSRRLVRGDYCSDPAKMPSCPECGCDDTFRITPVTWFGCGLEINRIVLKDGDQFRVASPCRRKDKRAKP